MAKLKAYRVKSYVAMVHVQIVMAADKEQARAAVEYGGVTYGDAVDEVEFDVVEVEEVDRDDHSDLEKAVHIDPDFLRSLSEDDQNGEGE